MMTTAQAAKGAVRSRTMWLALALAAVGALQTQADLFGMWLSPEMQGLATIGLGVAVAVLRVLTTTPLDER